LELTGKRIELDAHAMNLRPLKKVSKGLSRKRLNHPLLHGKNIGSNLANTITEQKKKRKLKEKKISSQLFRIMASPPLTSSYETTHSSIS
jgi:hypothetical protein